MNDERAPISQSTHWVGLDVAKKTFDAALVFHGQKWPATPLAEIPVHSFERTIEGVNQLLQWIDALLSEKDPGGSVRVVMEATGGYSCELAMWLFEQRASLAPAIAPPQQTAAFIASLGLRNKTDEMDARALGFYGMERQPPPYAPMTPEETELRELLRFRGSLVGQRVAAANRASETVTCKTVQQIESKRLRLLDHDIARVEQAMRQRVAKTPEIDRDIELLSSIYGVGFIVAVTIRAELGDLRRFGKARQLTAFAGLNPSVRTSGTSVCGRPRMSKKGNVRVRQILYLAAMVVIRDDNDLQRTYLHLREQGKSRMAALGAVMRKLLVLMRAILISGKTFDPKWKTRPKGAQNA